ncbi:probable cro protein [Microbacterium phage Min1]|uniref:Probable cro protein n=1 Tax=Microbacterium phage Min1 TaxID=446529 RepID=A6N1W1_9CAUD|nr:probable cro protein [Microbacterium phage Min1]ABR10433.1 probable cro protein [Microbacterium phage Min1]
MLADMTDQRIGIPDKVRGVCAEKGYTQERTAQTIGISRTQLVERYAGRTPFKADELLTLSLAMRVPVQRFFPAAAELHAMEDEGTLGLAVAS